MSEAQKRKDRFSKSRELAKELVADSIITDAAAQFIALMIEEIHKTKIKPLQDELARRAAPTLSAAMELPEVRALVEALGECKHITHKAYVAATMEAINAGPAHPLSKQMDVWMLRCMRAEERALAALAPFTEAKS